MNDINPSPKKRLILIATLIMLFFSLKDFNFSQLGQMEFKDILPIIVLTTFVFVLRAGIVSIILLSIRKLWSKLCKKD